MMSPRVSKAWTAAEEVPELLRALRRKKRLPRESLLYWVEIIPLLAVVAVSATSSLAAGFVVPTPTLPVFVLLMLVPLVVHCALTSAGLQRQSASSVMAATEVVKPLKPGLVVLSLISSSPVVESAFVMPSRACIPSHADTLYVPHPGGLRREPAPVGSHVRGAGPGARPPASDLTERRSIG